MNSRGASKTIFKYQKGKENRLFGAAYKREWVQKNLPNPSGDYFTGKVFNQATGRFVKLSTYLRNDGDVRNKYKRIFLKKSWVFSGGRVMKRPMARIAPADLQNQISLLNQTVNLELVSQSSVVYGVGAVTIKNYIIVGNGDYNIDRIFDLIINTMLAGRMYRVFMSNGGTHNKSTKWYTAAEFTRAILEKILLDNYNDLFLSDLKIEIKSYPIPAGGFYVPDPFLETKTKVLTPKNTNYLCGQICIALTNMNAKFRERFGRGEHSKKKLDKEVAKVCEILGTDPLNVDDFSKLGPFHRVVFINRKFEAFWDTHKDDTHGIEDDLNYKTTYLYLSDINGVKTQHYSLITNINAFVDCNKNFKWCTKCMARITKKKFKVHCCLNPKCKLCHQEFANDVCLNQHFIQDKTQPDKFWRHCSLCNIMCPNQECLDHHENHCDGKKWKCYKAECSKAPLLDRIMNNTPEDRASHVCGKKCKNCKEVWHPKHRCFIQKLDKKILKVPDRVFVYDLESMFSSDLQHIVNFAVVQEMGVNDPTKTLTFTNINDLVQWMLKQKRAKFIAHNAKAYDSWLIRAQLMKIKARPKTLIMAGNKIMMMEFASLTWIDSLNHLASSLAGLPKMFGMDTGLVKKGFFPFKFNIKENQSYVGLIPEIKYFEPSRMMPEKKKAFFAWHKEQEKKGVVYDFQKELQEYCINDVFILRKALEIYRKNALEANNGIDPLECCTIASYCMKVYRTNHLPSSQTVGVLTKDEYDFIKRGFFGGRTNATTLYKKITKSESSHTHETIRYKDIQSLYPFVQFFCDMPVGIPTHITENFGPDLHQFVKDTYGFIQVDITPPKGLYHPVLAERRDGRLIFDLLPKCAAVYSSVELVKALEKGYIVTKIYKALKFDKRNDIFKSYISQLLKGKIEASGTNLEGSDLDEFILEHKKRFGFDLDRDNLKRNEGYRALMKIQLNSLWGKFGQSLDKKTTVYVDKACDWFKILTNQRRGVIKDLDFHDLGVPDVLYVTYIENKNNDRALDTTSIAIAAMTTSHARLKLYNELDLLGDRVMYFDTDSIIYVDIDDPNVHNIPDGKFLGDWECETKGMPIHEFVSIAPKSYGYKYYDEEGVLHVECKFKGFTLNCENRKKINFDTMKALVDGELDEITTNNMRFDKDVKTGVITTTNMRKTAKMHYKKRQRVGPYGTLPFGY